MKTIRVDLGERSYPIYLRHGILSSIGACLIELGFKSNIKVAVITNNVVGGIYGAKVEVSLKISGFNPVIITMPDGEQYKTIEQASKLFDSLIEYRFERSSPIVALGGGVVGDIAGFVAATYLRGVPLIQVPTTLLAQVDSSVGGKTAVNHPKGKNLIGAFYQPKVVIIDPEVLTTLDVREVKAGLAEIVKYGVIRDKEFFAFLEEKLLTLLDLGYDLAIAIATSCAIKAEIVSADEREAGLRAILNFGHTFGHAIEALAGYGTYRHGEAVAVGMVMAAKLSVMLGVCKPSVAERIEKLVSSLGLPVEPPPLPADDLIASIKLDKKVTNERIRFVLVSDIGDVELRDVNENELTAFFERFYP
jgi:3-dehydroquinate synthase